MEETFNNFRFWLEYNYGKKANRAEELASRLRTIEQELSNEYGDNAIRHFYSRFKKIVMWSMDKITKDCVSILEDYNGIFDRVSKKKPPFDNIPDKVRDEYKAALRCYLLFVGTITKKFSLNEVNKYCPSKRKLKDEPTNTIPANIFKSGIINIMRKSKCMFPGKDSKTIVQTLEMLHSMMEQALDLHQAKNNNYDGLILGMITYRDSYSSFDWESLMVENMEVYVDDRTLPLENCQWVSQNYDELIVGSEYREEHFKLPVFTFSKHSKLSLGYIPSFNGTIKEHRAYMESLFAISGKIRETINNILPRPDEEIPFEDMMHTIEKNENTLKTLANETSNLLIRYASRFRVELIAE